MQIIEPESKKIKVLHRSKSNIQLQSNHQQKKSQRTLGDVQEEEESKAMSRSSFNTRSRLIINKLVDKLKIN